jgi:hypothetical protein
VIRSHAAAEVQGVVVERQASRKAPSFGHRKTGILGCGMPAVRSTSRERGGVQDVVAPSEWSDRRRDHFRDEVACVPGVARPEEK